MDKKIAVTIDIDQQLEQDLIITAYEGGSSYWAVLTDETLEAIDAIVSRKSGLAPSERLYSALQVGKSFEVNDAEEPETVLGTISKESMAKAWSLITGEKYVHIFKDIISENWDAISADVFFQLAVLGEVVYG